MSAPAPQRRNPPGRAGFETTPNHSDELHGHHTTPRRPTAGTQFADILAVLESGESLTSNDALQRFGCSRLAAVVHRLRRMGWAIQSRRVTVQCRGGRVARVARYRMPRSMKL